MKDTYDVYVPSEWEGEDSFPGVLDGNIESTMSDLHEVLMPLMKENARQEAQAMEAARKLILL